MTERKEGDCVKVISLNKIGVIVSVLAHKQYKVAIGAFTIICAHSDLEAATSDSKSSKTTTPVQSVQISAQRNPPKEVLDLHGLTVNEALAQLEAWLDQVVLSHRDRVTIIHGHGTGRIQNAVHRYLSSLSAVKHFKVNEYNSGETLVYL